MTEMFNITEAKFAAIVKNGLSLDTFYVLELVKKGIDVRNSFSIAKISSLISTLERKGYIVEGKLSPSGEELYSSIFTEGEEIVTKRMENKDEEWNTFLSYYPPNNRFVWKGKLFSGDRGIKCNTKNGRELFMKAINSGFSTEQLWKAVVTEAISKMEESYRTGQNKMQYFMNTESYLRQQKYMNFLEEGAELSVGEIQAYREAYNRKKKSIVSSNKSIDI